MHGLKHSINKELDSRPSVSGFNTPEVIVLYHVLGIKHPLTVQGSKGITVNWQRNIGVANGKIRDSPRRQDPCLKI